MACVQTPSTLMEAFLRDHRVVKKFARHPVSGAPIPEELLRSYVDSTRVFSGLELQEEVRTPLCLEWHVYVSRIQRLVPSLIRSVLPCLTSLPSPGRICDKAAATCRCGRMWHVHTCLCLSDNHNTHTTVRFGRMCTPSTRRSPAYRARTGSLRLAI